MPKWKSYKSEFLRPEHLEEGKLYVAIIQAVEEREFESRYTGKMEYKPVLTLITPEGRAWEYKWIPNRTAWKVLWQAWGSEMEDWPAHGINLFLGYTTAGGGQVLSILAALNPGIERGASPSPTPAPKEIVAPAANLRPRAGNGQAASPPPPAAAPSPPQEAPKRLGRPPNAQPPASGDDPLDDELPDFT
jgi:hypothetical protein